MKCGLMCVERGSAEIGKQKSLNNLSEQKVSIENLKNRPSIKILRKF